MYSKPAKALLLLVVALAVGLTACDSGGGMDSDPDPESRDVKATVEGTVTDDFTGDYIEGAEVSVVRTDKDDQVGSGTTDSGGIYQISFTVPEGNTPKQLRIEANANGFSATADTVGFDESVTVNLALPTATAPIEVGSLEELRKIGDDPNYPLDGHYLLISDIDASTTSTLNDGKGFKPIGSVNSPFEGSFDGNGFDISQLSVNRPKEDVGLFAAIGEGSSILDVSMKGVDLVGGTVGSIAGVVTDGESDGDITIRNVDARGSLSSDFDGGGIIGHVEAISNKIDVLIESSYSDVSVSNLSTAGGLIGSIDQSRTSISNSISHGDVSGYLVGGLVGYNSGSITSSSSTGKVSGRGPTGGLVGHNKGLSGVIVRSHANGDVEGEETVGGLVGLNEGPDGVIESSYSRGDVNGESTVGGFVGSNLGTIEESYASGNVTGDTEVGGFTGVNDTQAMITTSFWDVQATDQQSGIGSGTSDGLTGLTTDEMQGESAKENMTGFDFQYTWQIVTNPEDYPALD